MAQVRIGNLIVTDKVGRDGQPVYDAEGKQEKRVCVALGNQGKKPEYNLTVELIVKDNTGKVIAKQTDGFINLVDPRTQPNELYSAGIISEEKFHQMQDQLKSLPAKIKFQLLVPRI